MFEFNSTVQLFQVFNFVSSSEYSVSLFLLLALFWIWVNIVFLLLHFISSAHFLSVPAWFARATVTNFHQLGGLTEEIVSQH